MSRMGVIGGGIALLLVVGCGATPKTGISPASSEDQHFAAECTDQGHPPWRSDTHEMRVLVEDDVKLHIGKYPGHSVRVLAVQR